MKNLEPRHEQYYSEVFYTLSIQQINRYYYTSPSHYIGQYGAYEALRHIFEEAGMKHLLKDKSILLSRDHSLYDIEEAREIISKQYRSKHGIKDNDTVVFFAPGDTQGETDYTLEEFRKGFNEFIYKYSYPTSIISYSPKKSAFKLVVSLHKGTKSEQLIRDFIASNEFVTDVIIVTNENNEHYNSMCASDFGFVYNGQMVSAAAALHLPINTMQNMNDIHYFWHTWENRWLADINVIADRPAIPEFAAGEFWFGKIANTLAEMHTNTEYRWDQIRTLKPFILEALSFVSPAREKNEVRDKMYVDGDRTVYDEYADPIFIMSEKIHKSMCGFRNRVAIEPDLSVVDSIPSLKLNNSILSKL